MKLIPAETVVMQTSNVTPDTMRDYMFDIYLNTQTEFATEIEVEIDFDNVDRVALFNLDATDVDFELTDDDTSTVVQTTSVDLRGSDGEYAQWIIETLRIYANATLKVTINNAGSTAKCGIIGIGLSSDIGAIKNSSQPSFTDYSIKSEDGFGQTYLNQGAWSKSLSVTTRIPYQNIDAIFEDLVAVRGSLAFFEGNSDTSYEVLRAYGFVEDWSIVIHGPRSVRLNLEIKGVI